MANNNNTSYLCTACGWVYDPEQGDPDGGIAPGTPWEDIPDDWVCPVCGAGKEDFEPVENPSEEVPAAPAAYAERAPLVIVGSGLAGYTLAREVRKRDRELPVLLLTADGGELYSKPMLSNAIARHHAADDMVQKEAAELAKELGIEIRTRCWVSAVDRAQRSLQIEQNGVSETLPYDRLVLAMGADPRIFPAPGHETADIVTVNDLDDYRRWREQIGDGGRILLIGAGLIGCEFANDLISGGFEVAMVDPAPRPLARLLPKQIGTMLAEALHEHGCELHMERTVAAYGPTEHGLVAILDDGTPVPFAHALSAVGLAPRTSLAEAAGLEVDTGIRVDRYLQTSDPAIFALGDCAQTEAGVQPFIAPLLAEAKALAATLCGEPTPLHLPAMPVVVKTPALPLAICPPHAGAKGTWEVEIDADGAMALYRDGNGRELGFALAGNRTKEQHQLAKRMPELLPAAPEHGPADAPQEGTRYECGACSYVYDPAEGDPDGGIPPGTAWEGIPDDWVCPVCGAGKEEFSPIA